MRIGLYPGTFDPVHLGHLDIIRRAARLVDRLIIAVAINRNKNPLFSLDERVALIESEIRTLKITDCDLRVEPFENLLIHTAHQAGANVIIRGLRAVSDFEYEYQLVGMNRALDDRIETVFLMAGAKYQSIASRLVKEIARLEGQVDHFVPPAVGRALSEKF